MFPRVDAIPKRSEFHWLTLDELQHPLLRLGRDHWLEAKGQRLFPARRDLSLRAVARALPYMALLKVLNGGADFEHRFVGDVHVRAFRVALHRRRFSEIETEAPELVSTSRPNFLKVIATRAPLAFYGRTGREVRNVTFTNVECVLLPFGETDAAVDHIAAFAVY